MITLLCGGNDRVKEIEYKELGNIVSPSSLSYINDGFVYVGSVSGDHQLIRIHNTKNWRRDDDDDVDIDVELKNKDQDELMIIDDSDNDDDITNNNESMSLDYIIMDSILIHVCGYVSYVQIKLVLMMMMIAILK